MGLVEAAAAAVMAEVEEEADRRVATRRARTARRPTRSSRMPVRWWASGSPTNSSSITSNINSSSTSNNAPRHPRRPDRRPTRRSRRSRRLRLPRRPPRGATARTRATCRPSRPRKNPTIRSSMVAEVVVPAAVVARKLPISQVTGIAHRLNLIRTRVSVPEQSVPPGRTDPRNSSSSSSSNHRRLRRRRRGRARPRYRRTCWRLIIHFGRKTPPACRDSPRRGYSTVSSAVP